MQSLLRAGLNALPQAAAVLHAAGAAGPSQLVQLAAFATSPAAATGKLLGACIFERLPVVHPYPPEWEMEHHQWQQQLRQKRYKVLPREFIDPKQSDEAGGGGGHWQAADRVTEADRSGDRRTLRRRLDQFLFLLVRSRGAAASSGWTFPQAENVEGETMRQTAERALEEAVSLEGVQPFFVGNAPMGHAAAPAGDAGDASTTLFFHRCQLITGTPALRPGGAYSDHVWVAKDELADYIGDPALLELLRKML